MEQELHAPADVLLWTWLRREKSQCPRPVTLLTVKPAVYTPNKVCRKQTCFSQDHILNFGNIRDILALLRSVRNRAIHACFLLSKNN